MQNIYNLNTDAINRLTGIDPTLSPDWQEILEEIIPQLDEESQTIVKNTILSPKGITYSKSTGKFFAKKPETLAQILQSSASHNKQLIKAAHLLQDIYQATPPPPSDTPQSYDALLFIDELESALTYLDKVPINSERHEHKQRNAIRAASLYEIADWIDTITFKMPKNTRQINEYTFKIFIKEVFIKSLIQGRDFHFLEAVDLDLYGITHFPAFIQKQSVERKLLIVETKNIWFIISPPDTLGSNPFSLRRFLTEEVTGEFSYFNALALPKPLCDNPEAQAVMLKFVNRIFSLDRNISDELKKYAIHLKTLQYF